MKIIALFTLVLTVVSAGAASANLKPLPRAEIGFYGDAAGTVRVVFDDGPGTLDIYVVLNKDAGDPHDAGTVRFSCSPAPTCFGGVFHSWTSNFTVVGDPMTGAWVMNTDCSPGSVLLMTITFTVSGDTWGCCWYEPQPYILTGLLEADHCGDLSTFTEIAPVGLWINPNEHEICDAPVAPSTWGKIKAMYR
jgi:hypothetical protein